jgi:hypothetical protein
MKMFVNTSGLPLNKTKPVLEESIVVGTETDISGYPTRYGHCDAVKCCDNFVVFEQRRPPVLVMTKSFIR